MTTEKGITTELTFRSFKKKSVNDRKKTSCEFSTGKKIVFLIILVLSIAGLFSFKEMIPDNKRIGDDSSAVAFLQLSGCEKKRWSEEIVSQLTLAYLVRNYS